LKIKRLREVTSSDTTIFNAFTPVLTNNLFNNGNEHAKTLICFEAVQSSPFLTYESKKKLSDFLSCCFQA